jgi:hypothetical protein
MRFSILHISDLHRDLRDEVANGPLLDSLLRDFQHYADEDPHILRPSLCIVSGDLIYGVSQNARDADAELERQYQQAVELLIGLADKLFRGDRNRVILLPGNHDVSYPATIASSVRIDVSAAYEEERKLLVSELFAPRSALRWSWSEMCFYRIIDHELYDRRLEAFQKAYSEFYSGARIFSLAPEDQFAIFDYPDQSLSIAALSSCHRNDPMHRAGGFHPDAINSACRELSKPARAGRLLAATWHHNVGGGPSQDDVLDHEFVQLLIDTGVSLGFHGHQHVHDCVDERYRLGPAKRKMTIISASTLCADSANLRPGIPRGYNIVEIDNEDWMGRTHSRHMVNSAITLPIWGSGYFYATGKSYVDFDICQPIARRPSQLDNVLALERADEFLRKRQWANAVESLKDMRDVPMAHPLLLGAISELADDELTVVTLWPPSTNAEIILVGEAILSLRAKQRARDFLELDSVARNTDASVRETRQRIALWCSR